eukprot:c37142_g1_i1 orf=2-271(-)
MVPPNELTVIRSFWSLLRSKLSLIFGQVKLSTHMILIGILRHHSEAFSFCWQLIRAVYTTALWAARNKCIFQHHKDLCIRHEVEECWFKI